jgi:NAD(P)H-nitrite reductase large subunit
MTRLLVVGGDAAGMSAAHQALRTAARTGRHLEVVALEQTGHTSYSACGIPYWIAGDIDDPDDLVARTPARHRDLGIDMHTGMTARTLDLDRRVVAATAAGSGAEVEFGFDELVLATRSEPIVPDWARGTGGGLIRGVLPVKSLTDGSAWLDALLGAASTPLRGVVIGGGYIGLEMAEALLRRGLEVTLVTLDEVMATLDPDMGGRVRDTLTAAGIKVPTDTTVTGLSTRTDGAVSAVHADGVELQADVVVLGMGVKPGHRARRFRWARRPARLPARRQAAGRRRGVGSGGLLRDHRPHHQPPRVLAAGHPCQQARPCRWHQRRRRRSHLRRRVGNRDHPIRRWWHPRRNRPHGDSPGPTPRPQGRTSLRW